MRSDSIDMKHILSSLLLCLCAFTASAWTNYTIVGKGDSGQYKCNGKIVEDPFGYRPNSIQIILSDMLDAVFNIATKKQIDERTIQYVCYKDGDYSLEKYTIIKYKCPYGKNVYFYSFPALYNGDKETTYKTIMDK